MKTDDIFVVKEKENAYLTRAVADPISSGIFTIELKDTSNDFSM